MLTFPALLFGDETSSFEVVEREYVLELGVTIYNISVSIHLPLLQNIDQECLHVVWLLVG